MSFRNNAIPIILGFKGTPEPSHTGFEHIGYKTNMENLNAPNRRLGNLPVDIACGSELIFDYIYIIEYENVGDSLALVLKVLES